MVVGVLVVAVVAVGQWAWLVLVLAMVCCVVGFVVGFLVTVAAVASGAAGEHHTAHRTSVAWTRPLQASTTPRAGLP